MPKPKSEAEGDVGHDAEQRRDRGVDALALQVAADDRADDLGAEHLELADVGGLQGGHDVRAPPPRAPCLRPPPTTAAAGSAIEFSDGSAVALHHLVAGNGVAARLLR